MAVWHRSLTPVVLEQLDRKLEELRTLLILEMVGKQPGHANIDALVAEIYSIAAIPGDARRPVADAAGEE
jgi:hypothetical protein